MQVFLAKEKTGVLTKTGNTTTQYSSSVLTLGAKQYSSGNLVCDTSVSGVGGLDAGSVAANTLYYVYAVVDTTVKLIASTSEQKPSGYLVQIKVGAFETDGSSNIRDAYKIGNDVDSNWANFTMEIIDGNSADVKSSSPLTDVAKWRRDGKDMIVVFSYYHQTTVGSNGTGYYIFRPPAGYQIDTSSVIAGAGNSPPVHGSGNGDVGGGTLKQFLMVGASATGVLMYEKAGNLYVASGSTYSFNTAFVGITGEFRVPILGWAVKIDWTQY